MGTVAGIVYHRMEMEPQTPIHLRRKYSLVHVPSRRKVVAWADRCRREIAAGVPPESAGLIAAQGVFPYEAKKQPAPEGLPVAEILATIPREDSTV